MVFNPAKRLKNQQKIRNSILQLNSTTFTAQVPQSISLPDQRSAITQPHSHLSWTHRRLDSAIAVGQDSYTIAPKKSCSKHASLFLNVKNIFLIQAVIGSLINIIFGALLRTTKIRPLHTPFSSKEKDAGLFSKSARQPNKTTQIENKTRRHGNRKHNWNTVAKPQTNKTNTSKWRKTRSVISSKSSHKKS